VTRPHLDWARFKMARSMIDYHPFVCTPSRCEDDV
jgi:hypothetical protein